MENKVAIRLGIGKGEGKSGAATSGREDDVGDPALHQTRHENFRRCCAGVSARTRAIIIRHAATLVRRVGRRE